MAEFPDLGLHCQLPACQQLDFLPARCQHCTGTFCQHHLSVDSHQCSDAPRPAQVDPTRREVSYACHMTDCEVTERTAITCAHCARTFCLQHRHGADHRCPASIDISAGAQRRLEAEQRASDIQAERLAAPLAVTTEPKSARAQKTAARLRLMRIKQRARGDEAVPPADRLYLLVLPPGGDGRNCSVFVSRRWSAGRALDAIAALCCVRNDNDSSTCGRRLMLYRHRDGNRLPPATAVEQLLVDGQLQDGDVLVLEYGDPQQSRRDDVIKYVIG